MNRISITPCQVSEHSKKPKRISATPKKNPDEKPKEVKSEKNQNRSRSRRRRRKRAKKRREEEQKQLALENQQNNEEKLLELKSDLSAPKQKNKRKRRRRRRSKKKIDPLDVKANDPGAKENEENDCKNTLVTVLKGKINHEQLEEVHIEDGQRVRLIIGRNGETIKFLQRKHEVLVRQKGRNKFIIIGEKSNREAIKKDFEILLSYPVKRQLEKYMTERMCENDLMCFSKNCTKPHPIGRVIDLPKNKRQCRFGENCKTINCEFYHEKIRRKPACRSGAACTKYNCSFLHPPDRNVSFNLPKCKFGSSCSRTGCKFSHDTRVNENEDVDEKAHQTQMEVKKECRWAGECRNPKCFYKHPISWNPETIYQNRDCRFGLRCRNRDCRFNHPEGYEKPVIIE